MPPSPPPPTSTSRATDFSAGASAPRPAAPRRRRPLRLLGWVLAALVALLMVLGAGLWWWTGSSTSLATALARAARYLPADQQLESREVSGALRSGGRIGWLRWSSPGMAVEVTDITIGWQLAPLLQRRLELGDVHAARVQITRRDAPTRDPTPPPERLVLPLQLGLAFRVDQIDWAGPPAVQVLGLAGDYRFDGSEHRLNIANVDLAQGRYSASATLQAQAPMALQATVDGTLRTQVPGGGAALQAAAHATLEGTLATAAAQLQVQARIRPEAAAPASAAPASGATRSSAPPAAAAPGSKAAAPGAEPMQADLQATLRPWAPQPVESATATLRALNLAALWPQAPATLLSGSLQVGPTGATAPAAGESTAPAEGWSVQARLRNDLAGPWDAARLPLTALEADARLASGRWTVPSATLTVGSGSAGVQGQFTPATGAVSGQAELRNLPPAALHTALEAAPLSGRIRADMQGDAVRFNADIRAAAGRSAATAPKTARSAPLRIQTLQAQGTWQPGRVPASGPVGTAPAMPDAGGTLLLERLLIDALQARVEATKLRIAPAEKSAQGQLALTLPGATARANGSVAARSGAGEAQLQWTDADQTLRWLATLPVVGAHLQPMLAGASAKGAAQIGVRWKGGWEAALQQWQRASGINAASTTPGFEVQASASTQQLDLQLPSSADAGGNTGTAVQLRGVKATLLGSMAQAQLSLEGEARLNAAAPQQTQRIALQTRASGGLVGSGQWRVVIDALRAQVQDAQRPGPWLLQLAEPLTVTARTPAPGTAPAAAAAPSNAPGGTGSAAGSPSAAARATTAGLAVETSAGRARITGPAPGTVVLQWQPVRVSTAAGLQVQSQGTLQGLPMAWVDALGLGATPGAAGQATEPLLARIGLASSLVLDGQWNINTMQGLRGSASLRRASGDLRILAGDATAVTAVQSSGQGKVAGKVAAIATEASATTPAAGTPAGVRQAEVSLELDGEALRARLQWASDRAGEIDASASTRLVPGSGTADLSAITWAADAPLAGTLRASLPDMGVWSALAPPGWRVRGTLQANATLSGTRDAPRWAGTLGADDLAVRSVVDGVDLQGGRLRANLRGNELQITEFRLQGGRGSGARIAGFSGNRTAAPADGGTLTASGRIRWGDAPAGSGGMSGISMDVEAEARALQVLVRADRQLSVSGPLQVRLQQGQITVRGTITADRATIILPDESAPSLGSDVVVRSASKDREDQAKAQAAGKAAQAAASTEPDTLKPPDVAVTVNLGNDFALHGHGITTRLTGEVQVRSASVPGGPPRVTGEVRTEAGRYRAWGQMLDVETGLIRFNGPYNNPSLDILALRPNIAVRAGVQVTGSAQAPRVRLYSDPELPDAEKLSWVVLGRDAAAGGAEAAVLQQAALALLGRGGNNNTAGNIASRVGLDEIGFKGPGTGQDATGAALTFGKRLSKDLYVTYERSLSGTLGTLYIFYDLTRRLTLRGQTGEKSAVDIIYTVKYD
ncbi:translocation/assembly module TamB domain-containing protein [Acidovorax sp. BL-A-41-H1]|uniref:translocation/assembly module TamB domain-containing protein n=1 Tax=Acidovorax sp. BL-A-41-H1 TaxID=3421102 RepID=UPI003F7B27F6